jgi:hypothetical protein
MKKLITEFNQTGNCIIDVAKVVKSWNDNFSISQYHEDYKLVKQFRGNSYAKVMISKEQAEILIDKLKLLPIQSGMLRFGKHIEQKAMSFLKWNEYKKCLRRTTNEIQVLRSVISEFTDALDKKQ